MPLTRRDLVATMAAGLGASFLPACAHRLARAAPADFAALDALMPGRVLTRSAASYDAARHTFSRNPRANRYPAAIALCGSSQDVASAVTFARRHQLEIAVRSGGHDALAASTCDDGLLIDLGGLNAITLGENGTVRVGPGVRAGVLQRRLAEAGLAAVTGNNGDVAMGGLTLGGGLGQLLASHGAACDNLLGARLVSAGGDLLDASPAGERDLLWALRGGGGNFGIATEFELQAHRAPAAIGGMLLLDGAGLRGFMEFYAEFMAPAPRELVVEALVVGPGGRPMILVVVCHVGGAAAAEADLAPLRGFPGVLADGIRAAPLASVAAPTPQVAAVLSGGAGVSPLFDPAATSFAWRGGSLAALTPGSIDALAQAVAAAPGRGWMVGFNHYLHGAVCEVGPDSSPLPRPRGAMTFLVSARWGNPEDAAANLGWVDQSWAAFDAHAAPAYVNYLSTEDPAAIAAAYGPGFARLRQLKRRYDPDNIFHRNRNIPPAAS